MLTASIEWDKQYQIKKASDSIIRVIMQRRKLSFLGNI